MSLLRTAMEGISQIRADITGTPAPWDDFWYTGIGPGSASGMRVSPDTAKRLSAVTSCVNKIAKTVAMLPLKIYSDLPDGGKKVAINHPLFDVMYSRPNYQQTAFEWRQMMQGHLELRGNAYSEIISGRRRAIDQLIPMHPDRVYPERLTNGRVRYRYNDPLVNTDRYLVQEQVFHLRNFMDDGIVGQSTVALGVDTIGIGLAAQDYYARFLKNDARPGVVLTGANFKNKEDKLEFREDWQRSQTGSNRHKAAVLPAGMDLKTLGVNSHDAELLDARKFSRIEVCSLFDVPPHLIGETEKTATYASVEQFNIMFATYCILPRLVLWEQAIMRSLIFQNAYFPKFSMGALLRGDNASRAAFYKTMIEMGVFCQNDVLIMEDMNPIPDGGNHWRPMNWARLGDVHTSLKPNNGEGSGQDDEEEQTTDSGEQPQQLVRLKIVAAMAAEPCVRKEVNTVRKLAERASTKEDFNAELNKFYSEHSGFLTERIKLTESAARSYCQENREFLSSAPDHKSLDGRLDAVMVYGTKILGREVTI